MATVYLMEHQTKGRMHVPQAKQQEYLNAGFVVIERIVRPEIAPSPKAAALAPEKAAPKAPAKKASTPKKKASKK